MCRDEACAGMRELVEEHYGQSFHAHSLGGAITLGKVRFACRQSRAKRNHPQRIPRETPPGATPCHMFKNYGAVRSRERDGSLHERA